MTCHSHGTCKPDGTPTDACTCSEEWTDLVETDPEDTRLTYTTECFSPTQAARDVPGYVPYQPARFTPKSAELRSGECGADVPYAVCTPLAKDDAAVVNVTGIDAASTPCGTTVGCADGTVSIISRGASCSAAQPNDILMADIPVATSAQEGVRVSDNITLTFDPQTTPYQICYRPRNAPGPASVQSYVATKAAPLGSAGTEGDDKDGSGGGGGGGVVGIVVGIVVGLLVLAGVVVAGVLLRYVQRANYVKVLLCFHPDGWHRTVGWRCLHQPQFETIFML